MKKVVKYVEVFCTNIDHALFEKRIKQVHEKLNKYMGEEGCL